MPRAVFIASPHTSNLDGLFMVATAFAMGVKLSWMGKKSLFRFPFGYFFRSVGGVAVDRSKSSDTVKQVADEFAARPSMFLAIAPAATRKKRDYWKSGFYHIAVGAKVPLLCGCIDYERKEAGIIGVVEPTGDPVVDMARIRAVYEGRQGRHPDRMSRIRLRAEDEVKSEAS
jgi:1-acyl-sn-glycerol-3-phosphate acyltransferase